MADAIPFIRDFPFAHGRSEQIRPGVRRVIANNPGPFTYTGSGTYIIGEGETAVIDPGPDCQNHLNALLDALESERVTHILVTHTHKDHCGLARRLADATGAPVLAAGAHPGQASGEEAPALDEGGDRAFRPDRVLADGDRIAGDGWALETVATPGHLSNHLCFALAEQGVLFTGDHVMGWSTTVVAPPDGDMSDYMNSLESLLARDDSLYLPTHGGPIEKPRAFVRAIRTHRLMRDAQILDRLKRGDTQITEITRAIYADVDKRLHGAAALNVLAHLIRLHRLGAVACNGNPGMDSIFTRMD
ncbi:MAG: MBL fold metallo-hydrolase [Parvularculaceae bacterium]